MAASDKINKKRTKKDVGKTGWFYGFRKYLSDRYYDFTVFLKQKKPQKKGNLNLNTQKKKRLIFYIAFMIFPVAQFCVFYIGINTNSILLAFKDYNYEAGRYYFSGLKNFREVWRQFFDTADSGLKTAAINSVKLYFAYTLVGVTLSLLFSFYVYKAKFGSQVFKVILFMPSVISSVVLVILFRTFTERGLPIALEKIFNITLTKGLLSNLSTRFGTLVFYSIWVGFGTNIIMYSGAMSRIPPELIESGSLDGLTDVKEFIYITLPLIYPTLSAFLVVGMAGLFMNQASAYEFFGNRAKGPEAEDITTVGLFLFVQAIGQETLGEYPFAAAAGIMFTLVAAPLTLTLKWLLEKLGPKVEF